MPKIITLELTPEDMMHSIETLAEMLVSLREYPNLVKAIPRDPKALAITVMQQVVARREQSENKEIAEADRLDEQQLEQSVKAFQEAMAKAAGK